MAIVRTIRGVDIQWDLDDPVLSIRLDYDDDVEGTSASRKFSFKRSEMGAGGQLVIDDFLASILSFTNAQAAGAVIFPIDNTPQVPPAVP